MRKKRTGSLNIFSLTCWPDLSSRRGSSFFRLVQKGKTGYLRFSELASNAMRPTNDWRPNRGEYRQIKEKNGKGKEDKYLLLL